MSHIQPEYFTVNHLLNYKFFEIPNYQRTYSRTRKQREDLFNDILKIPKWRDKEQHHFMATIVCLNQHESKQVGSDRYDKKHHKGENYLQEVGKLESQKFFISNSLSYLWE